ncbi:MAG: 3-methylaspartate ammonia-lyase, partial [Sphaerochaetaceae bacterium]|nr:3-methylaspartate ammonia-lyase [Sphaerochaetaceae bacterium]
PGYELGIMFEVLAKTQETASAICASTRSTFLHYGYEGRKSTAGNLAFPFAPSDVEFGPVYEFSVYHLMEIDDPCEFFPIEKWEIK